ncbi:MAG: hypothetical protein FWE03_07130 [Firmicutes bacterium]|nr:hypothetical protein [Bacillota bacterium]
MKKKFVSLVLTLSMVLSIGFVSLACDDSNTPLEDIYGGVNIGHNLGAFNANMGEEAANTLLDDWHDALNSPNDMFNLGPFSVESNTTVNQGIAGRTQMGVTTKFDGNDLYHRHVTQMSMMGFDMTVQNGLYFYDGIFYYATGFIDINESENHIEEFMQLNRIGENIEPLGMLDRMAYVQAWVAFESIAPFTLMSSDAAEILLELGTIDSEINILDGIEFAWARSYANGYVIRFGVEFDMELDGFMITTTGSIIFVFDNDGRLVEVGQNTVARVGRIVSARTTSSITIDFGAVAIDWTDFYNLRERTI